VKLRKKGGKQVATVTLTNIGTPATGPVVLREVSPDDRKKSGQRDIVRLTAKHSYPAWRTAEVEAWYNAERDAWQWRLLGSRRRLRPWNLRASGRSLASAMRSRISATSRTALGCFAWVPAIASALPHSETRNCVA